MAPLRNHSPTRGGLVSPLQMNRARACRLALGGPVEAFAEKSLGHRRCPFDSVQQRRHAREHVADKLGRCGLDQLGASRLPIERAHLVAEHDTIGA